MIARTQCEVEEQPLQNQPLSWQDELSRMVRSPRQLLQLLELPDTLLAGAEAAAELFPLRVPHPYLDRIEKGNPLDPLLLQVLPLHAETLEVPGYTHDPLGEADAIAEPGILHKYHGRVLLIASGACAINCRYCFRRHFPYQDNNPGSAQWQRSLRYIADHPDVEEVILSGGDPLAVGDKRLEWLVAQLEAIPHVRRLRIHTRLPIVIPQRVNDDLLAWLGRSRLGKVVVIHANHPQELDLPVKQALNRLRSTGAMLLNQAVLLKGINDRVETLEALSLRLFEFGVLPYYVHLLDAVAGAAHFDAGDARAKALLRELATRLPGYLVPRLVREEAGMPGKSLVLP